MLVTFVFLSIIILIIFAFWLYCKLSTGYCKCSKHLLGKVAIITGANAGIGFETARDLAERGARVILACRNETKGIAARDHIIATSGNSDVHFYYLDLSSLESVRNFVDCFLKKEQSLHILINNAGCYLDKAETTKDGLLTGLQVNHFGPFLLTNLLLPLIKQSAPSRIINVSSLIHVFGRINLEDINMEHSRRSFIGHYIYFNSKLCNILMTIELNRRIQGTNVTVNCLNPGLVKTNIVMDSSFMVKLIWTAFQPFFKSPRAGAQTSIYLAVSPDVEGVSGSYFQDCHVTKSSRKAQDIEIAQNLWSVSEKIVSRTQIQAEGDRVV